MSGCSRLRCCSVAERLSVQIEEQLSSASPVSIAYSHSPFELLPNNPCKIVLSQTLIDSNIPTCSETSSRDRSVSIATRKVLNGSRFGFQCRRGFPCHPDRPQGPRCFLNNEYWLFRGGNTVCLSCRPPNSFCHQCYKWDATISPPPLYACIGTFLCDLHPSYIYRG
jgi:hypothetical protein